MVNNNSLREHIQQIDKNYAYSMPTGLRILITILRTLMTGVEITIFFYCKYNSALTHSKTSFIFWCILNP